MMTLSEIESLNQRICVKIESKLTGAVATVSSDDGHHFSVKVVYAGFEGCNLLAQHRLVYGAIGEDVGVSLHAVAVSAQLPASTIGVCDE